MTPGRPSLLISFLFVMVFVGHPTDAGASAAVGGNMVAETGSASTVCRQELACGIEADDPPPGLPSISAPCCAFAADDPALWGGVIESDPSPIRSDPAAVDALWPAHMLGIQSPHGVENPLPDDADESLPSDFAPQALVAIIVLLAVLGVGAVRYRLWLQHRRWQKSAARRRWRRRRERVERLARHNV